MTQYRVKLLIFYQILSCCNHWPFVDNGIQPSDWILRLPEACTGSDHSLLPPIVLRWCDGSLSLGSRVRVPCLTWLLLSGPTLKYWNIITKHVSLTFVFNQLETERQPDYKVNSNQSQLTECILFVSDQDRPRGMKETFLQQNVSTNFCRQSAPVCAQFRVRAGWFSASWRYELKFSIHSSAGQLEVGASWVKRCQ